MEITTFKRYEKKFKLTEEQYNKLIPRLEEYMIPDEHCKENGGYCIYNIYYDTDDNRIIRHSLSKPYYKEKLRLRSYKVPKSMDEKVFLEIKKKIGGIVNKRRVIITLKEAYDFINKGIRPKYDDYFTNQVLNEMEYFFENNDIHPAAFICYEREAFFGKDNKDFRITFDQHILTRRTDVALEKGKYGEELLEPGQRLMEVKILGAMPLWLAEIFSELGIYSSSFSKYGNEFKKYISNEEYSNNDRRKEVC